MSRLFSTALGQARRGRTGTNDTVGSCNDKNDVMHTDNLEKRSSLDQQNCKIYSSLNASHAVIIEKTTSASSVTQNRHYFMKSSSDAEIRMIPHFVTAQSTVEKTSDTTTTPSSSSRLFSNALQCAMKRIVRDASPVTPGILKSSCNVTMPSKRPKLEHNIDQESPLKCKSIESKRPSTTNLWKISDHTSLLIPFQRMYNRCFLISGFPPGLQEEVKNDLLKAYIDFNATLTWISDTEVVVIFESDEAAAKASKIPIHGLLSQISLQKYVANNYSYYTNMTKQIVSHEFESNLSSSVANRLIGHALGIRVEASINDPK